MTAPTQKPVSATNPWSWARVVYAVFALTVFCFPGGMVDWLDERNASGWLAAPLALARGVDAASAAVGAKGVGQGLRKWFAQVVGDSES
ncbi:MAG: hypothetical protein ACLPSW_08950 [Roseiarcus sp.]